MKEVTVSIKVIASQNAPVLRAMNLGRTAMSEALVGTWFIAFPVFTFFSQFRLYSFCSAAARRSFVRWRYVQERTCLLRYSVHNLAYACDVRRGSVAHWVGHKYRRLKRSGRGHESLLNKRGAGLVTSSTTEKCLSLKTNFEALSFPT